MKRVLALVCVLGIAAIATAMVSAQSAREGLVPSDDPVNVGGLYRAGFCGPTSLGPGIQSTYFYMRVTKKLTQGWYEADVSYDFAAESKQLLQAFHHRINTAQLCYVTTDLPKPK